LRPNRVALKRAKRVHLKVDATKGEGAPDRVGAASMATGFLATSHQSLITSHLLLSVDDAAEADGGGAVSAGGHEEKFFVLVEAVGLREVPDGA